MKIKELEKEAIKWEKEYEQLRIMHSILKGIVMISPFGKKLPVWFGETRKLPKKYGTILWTINELLYDAEEYVSDKVLILENEGKRNISSITFQHYDK